MDTLMTKRLAKKIAYYTRRNIARSRRFFRRHPEFSPAANAALTLEPIK
jgi:hypothetical protein